MTNRRQGRGLDCVPESIEASASPELLETLANDGHGISFPCKGLIQVRITRGDVTHGGTFPIRRYGDTDDALKAAMSLAMQLREKHGEIHSKRDNVYWVEKLDQRRNRIEYQYRVQAKVEGRNVVKQFSFGHVRPSPDKQLHGYRTAKFYRHLLRVHGHGFNKTWFKQWKHRRLYEEGYVPFDWDNT